MRLLVVTDLHYSLPQFDWVAKQAEAADAVVIAGDLLDLAGHVDQDSQILVVQKYLERIGAGRPLLVCSGNHDGDEKTAGGEYVARWLQAGTFGPDVVVDGQSRDLGPVRVTVCAWWDGPETRARLVEQLEASRPEPGRDWLWVHHAPPEGSPVAWTGKKDAGDTHLRELIGRFAPTAVVSGHIHNAPFREPGSWVDRVGTTWVFNPGRQSGALPAHLWFDWTTGVVSHWSLAGAGERSLR